MSSSEILIFRRGNSIISRLDIKNLNIFFLFINFFGLLFLKLKLFTKKTFFFPEYLKREKKTSIDNSLLNIEKV